MRKNARMILMVVLVFGLTCMFMSGCAKKSTIKEATAIGAEQSAAREAAAKEKAVEPKTTVKESVPEQVVKKEAEQKPVAKVAPPREAVAAGPTFELIHFDYDKYDLKPESRNILSKVGDFLKENVKYILRIEGHCDERGTAEYNMALGQRRADEAMKYLEKLGIADARITTLSYGKELPLDPENTEEAWAKNRRDNFVLILTK